jgi:hypothetical protein
MPGFFYHTYHPFSQAFSCYHGYFVVSNYFLFYFSDFQGIAPLARGKKAKEEFNHKGAQSNTKGKRKKNEEKSPLFLFLHLPFVCLRFLIDRVSGLPFVVKFLFRRLL